MARPFTSLDKVIMALNATSAQTVVDLHESTGLSEVQVRRAIWRGRSEGLVHFAQPPRRPGSGRAHYQYALTEHGEEQVETSARRVAEADRRAAAAADREPERASA